MCLLQPISPPSNLPLFSISNMKIFHAPKRGPISLQGTIPAGVITLTLLNLTCKNCRNYILIRKFVCGLDSTLEKPPYLSSVFFYVQSVLSWWYAIKIIESICYSISLNLIQFNPKAVTSYWEHLKCKKKQEWQHS